MCIKKKTLLTLSIVTLLALVGCSQNPSMIKKIKELKAEQIKEDKESPVRKTKEKIIKKDISKEELLDTVRGGTDKFFEMLKSYDYDSERIEYKDEDGQNVTYSRTTEEFNSYEKIRSYLNPYWSNEAISYLFANIAKEVDGVVYFKFGDIGEMSDLYDVKSLELRGSDKYKILRIESVFYDYPYDISEFIFTYERGKWVIEATNFDGFLSITDEIGIKFEARKKELLGESNYERN